MVGDLLYPCTMIGRKREKIERIENKNDRKENSFLMLFGM